MDKDTLNDARRFASEASKEIAPQIQSVMSNMQNDANALYVRYANQAAIRASKVGREKTLREAVTKLANERVCAYSYTRSDGTVVHVPADVGIRRMINDVMRERQITQELNIADRVGVNLVEVNSTANARPSHEMWQGKIYSIHGSTPEYPNFEESCHVGDPVKGIGGYNCGHTVSLYYEGFSRVYGDPLKDTDYTTEQVRELTTQQREYERDIRKEKRMIEVLTNCGFNAKVEKTKLAITQAALTKLINDNSEVLTRRMNYREGVYGRTRAKESQAAKETVFLTGAQKELLDLEKAQIDLTVIGCVKLIPSTHLLYRMTERNITLMGVINTIEYPESVEVVSENAIKYISKEATVIVNPKIKVVVTVMRSHNGKPKSK